MQSVQNKNAGFFASGNSGNWGPRDKGLGGLTSGGVQSDRFGEGAGALRFTSKKGGDVMNKFMQPAGGHGVMYDENLGGQDDNVKVANLDEGVAPLQFSGKLKLGTQATEADIQREKYLAECRQRADEQTERDAEVKEQREMAPKFTSNKGGRNTGLFMADGEEQQQQQFAPQQNNGTSMAEYFL